MNILIMLWTVFEKSIKSQSAYSSWEESLTEEMTFTWVLKDEINYASIYSDKAQQISKLILNAFN